MSNAYTRLYHKFASEYPDIYADDHAYATWVRLLQVADASWPLWPPVPRSVRQRVLNQLVVAGVVILSRDTYTVLGLEAERTRRSESARIGAAKRWQSERNANAMPSRDETRQDEPSTDARADLDAFLAVRYRPPTPAQRTLMDAYVQVFDVTGPARAERLIYANPDDPIGALKADLAAFREQRKAEAVASETPKLAPRRKAAGLSGINGELAAMLNAQYAEEAKP